MEQINGKILVFTDIHFGIKNNQQSRQNICEKVIQNIIDYIRCNSILTCIFIGDYFHSRTSLSVDTINIAYKCIQELAKNVKLYMILGNHDLFLKDSVDINSIKIFSNINNVKIISKTEIVSINGNKTLFVPWLGNTSKYTKKSFDMLFGHFNVNDRFLIQQYVKDNIKNTISDAVLKEINDDIDLKADKYTEPVGDFVELAVENGLIFSGHIHLRKEFNTKNRKFIFVGSPYQQNLGEKDNICGFYIINSDNTYNFIEISNVPKHIQLRMSELLKGKDISKLIPGNIIHKIYDVEVNPVDDAKIQQKINDLQPYEELIPDYQVEVTEYTDNNDSDNRQYELIKKSKLEYIKTYINNIDDTVLSDQKVDKNNLYIMLESYYNKVNKEK